MTDQHRALCTELADELERIVEDLVIPEYAHTEQERTDAALALVARARACLSATPEQHRATPEQWLEIERRRFETNSDWLSCLLELRARVEALEAGQRCQFVEIDTSQWTDEERQRVMQSAKEPGRFQPLRVETVYTDPSVPVEGMVREVSMGDEPWLVQVDGIQHGPAMPPTPSPADSLVERVALAIGESEREIPETGSAWTPEARGAIREVAAWMDEHECDPDDARRLRDEASR